MHGLPRTAATKHGCGTGSLARLPAALLLAACLCLPAALQAEEGHSIEHIRQGIEAARAGDSGRFAPQTVSRAEAYLGAALLAGEQNKPEDVSLALNMAGEALAEAAQTAKSFREQHRELLALRLDAREAVRSHSAAGQKPEQEGFQHLIDKGEKHLKAAIELTERGQLNQGGASAAEAKDAYRQALANTIPWISENAATAMGKAAAAGAKRYAPRTYQAAKAKLNELRAYADGITDKVPGNPADALHLASQAHTMAQQVKQWRREAGSHEALVLQEMEFRHRLAGQLGLPVPADVLLTDVSERELLQAASRLNRKVEEARQAGREESARLKREYEAELQGRIEALKEELQQVKNEQLSGMKDAFRAKLEKETYETNRQKAVHALFREGEVTILANLDGSLLIRLQRLKFPSGKSKVDSAYYDILGRLKEALDIYADRHVRIEGHTDNLGEVKANQLLSLKRAEAVRDFLIAAGVDGSRLKALGYGEVRPIASNEFDKGREMNRRIDIAIEAAR